MIPPFLALIGSLFAFVLLTFVVPRFEASYAEAGINLSSSTQLVIDVSRVAQELWVVAWAVIAVFTGIICFLSIQTRERKSLHTLVTGLALLPTLVCLLIGFGLLAGDLALEEQPKARTGDEEVTIPNRSSASQTMT